AIVYTDDWDEGDQITWEVIVEEDEVELPEAERNYPDFSVSVDEGDSEEFSLDVSHEDGDLGYVEWYVDGELETSNTISGTSVTDVHTQLFEQSGEKQVEAIVYTDEWVEGEQISWEVIVEDRLSEDISIQAQLKPYYPVDESEIPVQLENPTDEDQRINVSPVVFAGGDTIDAGSESEITIPAGETQSVALQWNDLPRAAEDEPVRVGVATDQTVFEDFGQTYFITETTDVTFTIRDWETNEPLEDLEVSASVEPDGINSVQSIEFTP
ncbi:hypothetical protein, partial [Actinoplanes cyaneus]|uniref:hypothetical protein n=1 Tax=Actinoplanes cyaneus TaxID=52696 RepID=UPI0031E28BEE